MKKKILFLFVSIICLPLLSGCDFNPIEFVKDKVDGVIDFFNPNDSEGSSNINSNTSTSYGDTSSYTSDSSNTSSSTSYVVTYTVLWKDGDGNILETDTVKSGDIASYDGETPTKQSDNTYKYSFKGWDKELINVYEDIVYNAIFDKCSNELKIEHGKVIDCDDSATNIIIPSVWAGYEVTSIEYGAFADCNSLISITIPNSITYIGERAFADCSSLQTIYCESLGKPNGWSYAWDWGCNANIIWGHTS